MMFSLLRALFVLLLLEIAVAAFDLWPLWVVPLIGAGAFFGGFLGAALNTSRQTRR